MMSTTLKNPNELLGPETQDPNLSYPTTVALLVKLVGDLPNDVSKESGAQVIKMTLEAMGLPMEKVFAEVQQTQTQLLESARQNLSRIEAAQSQIRKLENAIQRQQEQANELSGLIDLFILPNTTNPSA